MAKDLITIAKYHAKSEQLDINYLQTSIEDYCKNNPHKKFDIITSMEMLEHVPDPCAIITNIANLLKPNGKVFLSTINRNIKSFVNAIIGAEYILKILPAGTHDYKSFITPAEITSMLRVNRIKLKILKGINYNIFTKKFSLCDDISVNYLVYGEKF